MPRRDQFNSEAEWLAHLRLYFAAKAMQGYCAREGSIECEALDIANDAYEIADAMLAARSTEAK